VSAHAALRARFVAHIKATGLPLVQTEAKDKVQAGAAAAVLFCDNLAPAVLFRDNLGRR
jgi:hypothetical protein